mmetsp:Transcript_7738/g.32009  ORF Transcript_7738/g.32009 Transcript_7738/m.32009 type:complete len:345 (-) Transcript_7738:230-1264(-)
MWPSGRRRRRRRRAPVAIVVLAAVVATRRVAGDDDGAPSFYELKCSACLSIVAELERDLETEKPRMNVDLRKTLAGSDKGKVVDYSVSELRTLELLEGLCPKMQHYGITKQEDGTASFQRHSVGGGSIHISGTMKIGTKKYHDDRTKLTTYCDGLLEEHEDLLSEAIRAAGVAQLGKRQEEHRLAEAKRRGDSSTATEDDPYDVLGLAPGAHLADVRTAYRRLSRELHPDKTGGDPEALKRFVKVAAAYEKATGDKHQPYEDLYRQICVDIVHECKDEAEVDYVKGYFPKYYGSDKFERPKDDASTQIADSTSANKSARKKRKKKKKTASSKPQASNEHINADL